MTRARTGVFFRECRRAAARMGHGAALAAFGLAAFIIPLTWFHGR